MLLRRVRDAEVALPAPRREELLLGTNLAAWTALIIGLSSKRRRSHSWFSKDHGSLPRGSVERLRDLNSEPAKVRSAFSGKPQTDNARSEARNGQKGTTQSEAGRGETGSRAHHEWDPLRFCMRARLL